MESLATLCSFLWIFLDVGGLMLTWYVNNLVGLIVMFLGIVSAFIGVIARSRISGLATAGAVISIVLWFAFIYALAKSAGII